MCTPSSTAEKFGLVESSVALLVARWTKAIPAEFRDGAEEIIVTAALAGVDLRGLAAICAEIRERTAGPDPDDDPGDDPRLDQSVSVDTTMDGAGVMRGDLTAECAAMVTSVLDAPSAPTGAGTCGPSRSGTTMRWRRRCVRCVFASCWT
jgi:hypothetical protein